ncbi:MAG: hypothetical protein LBI96_06335, partial [Odoribacteraceae bacterium]|nr:hypothetical protein [Odoribacteraceae bacterium]
AHTQVRPYVFTGVIIGVRAEKGRMAGVPVRFSGIWHGICLPTAVREFSFTTRYFARTIHPQTPDFKI